MAYPPEIPPSTRNEDTLQAGTHAPDHNALAAAIRDIVAELGANPAGAYADLDSRIEAAASAGEGAVQADDLDALVAALLADGATPSQVRAALDAAKPSVRLDVFTASGTWTKPAGATRVVIEGWGGGGGGDNRSGGAYGGGGGGGGYGRIEASASELNATETITVGAAGLGRTASAEYTSGGYTQVTIGGYALTLGNGGGAASNGGSGGSGHTGAGGAGGSGSTNATAGVSVPYGGGGGSTNYNATPGTSAIGGDGGTLLNGGTGVGSIPGGGGKGNSNGSGANGARGEVRILTYFD